MEDIGGLEDKERRLEKHFNLDDQSNGNLLRGWEGAIMTRFAFGEKNALPGQWKLAWNGRKCVFPESGQVGREGWGEIDAGAIAKVVSRL